MHKANAQRPTSAALANQLKSLNDACQHLLPHVGSDAKSSELLHCMRGLVSMLVVETETAPPLATIARQELAKRTPAIEALIGAKIGAADQACDVVALLHESHARLTALHGAEAAALRRHLVAIEGAYLDGFEQAFIAVQAACPGSELATADIDRSALRDYLAKIFTAPALAVESVETISGGFSKQTMKVALCNPGSGAKPSAPDTLILRLDLPAETAFSGTRVADEYSIIETAFRHGVRVPQPYALEASAKVLGRAFIVLGLVSGHTVGTLFNYPPANAELGADIARQLAAIHTVPSRLLGPEVTGPEKSTREHVQAEIAIARRNWVAIQRQSSIVEEAFHTLTRLIDRADGAHCLVHGDFALHNIMVANGEVSSILDWEFAKLGNPADDLAYFQDTAHHLMGWDNFLAEYARAGGTVPPQAQIDFYRLLALTRICVLISQADAAFVSGVLPQIRYAAPGSLFLRGMMVKLAKILAVS